MIITSLQTDQSFISKSAYSFRVFPRGLKRLQSLLVALLLCLALFQPTLHQNPECPDKDVPCMRCDKKACVHCAYVLTSKDKTKSCLDTKITIPNCLVQREGDDFCAICKTGYSYDKSKKSCEKGTPIDNCSQFGATPGNSTHPEVSVSCQSCSPGYFDKDGNSKSCDAIPSKDVIQHCKHQDAYKVEGVGYNHYCIQCENKFASTKNVTNNSFSDTVCSPTTISGCIMQQVENGKPDVCLQCNTDQDLFITKSGCKPISYFNLSNPSDPTSKSSEKAAKIPPFVIVLSTMVWLILIFPTCAL